MDNFETRPPGPKGLPTLPRVADDIIRLPHNGRDEISHLTPRDSKIPSTTSGTRVVIGRIIPLKKPGIRMRRRVVKTKAPKSATPDERRYTGSIVQTPEIPSITGGKRTVVTEAKSSMDQQVGTRRGQDLLIKIAALHEEEFMEMAPLPIETVVQNLLNIEHPDDSDDLLKDLSGKHATRRKRENQIKKGSHLNHWFLDNVAKELLKRYPRQWVNSLNLDRVIIIARELLSGDVNETRLANLIENWSRMPLPR